MSNKTENFEHEDLIPDCIQIIKHERTASVSLFQRRLRLGYTRAAAVMDELEKRGVVGPAKGGEPRDILIDLNSESGDGQSTPLPGPLPGRGGEGSGSGSESAGHAATSVTSPVTRHPSPPESSHNDRAISMTKSARKAACKKAGESWGRARAANEVIGQQRIDRMNAFREVGEHINVACGREQLLFTVDGNIFCREQLLPELPADMGIDAVKGCVHLANKLDHPVTTVAEVEALEKQFQEEFALIGLVPSRRLRELQQAHTKDHFNHFVSVCTSVKSTLKDLEMPDAEGGLGPMDRWPLLVLEDFLENTKPVKQQIERAEQLAGALIKRGGV